MCEWSLFPPHSGPGHRLMVFYNLQRWAANRTEARKRRKNGRLRGGGVCLVWCDGPLPAERKLGSGRGTHANHPSKQSFFFPWEANVLVNGMTMCHSTTAFGHALDRTGHASWRTVSARYGRGHAKRHWWLKSNCPRLTYDRLRITAAIMWSGRGLHGMGMGTSWFACGMRISIEGGGIGASWPDPVALIPVASKNISPAPQPGGKKRLRDGASSCLPGKSLARNGRSWAIPPSINSEAEGLGVSPACTSMDWHRRACMRIGCCQFLSTVSIGVH
ncbi:hypothetical protein HDV62DRAFT_151541 [Trichoderma sp. SZMC 28011]